MDTTYTTFWRTAVIALIAGAVLAAVIFGGWAAGWWFTAQGASKSYQVTQNGTSNQDTLRAQITKNFTLLTQEDVQLAQARGDQGLTGEIKVEEAAVAGQLCLQGEQVNTAVPLPHDQYLWFQGNCTLGVVAPNSQYFIPSAP